MMDTALTEIKRPKPTIDQEVAFGIEELFFSRTDKRGVITAGNTVFQRISLYEWDELIGRPHNIIRHPDMPRAVFWLLWETIEAGAPIGAYVKNRAKDGRYYWVFAIVTPIDGGYLSVRLKPSAMPPLVIDGYKALVEASASARLSPRESSALLLKWLSERGFEDYPAFMAAALSAEMKSRDSQLSRRPDSTIANFDRMVLAAKSLLDKANQIFMAYEKNSFVPLNLGIRAVQLGEIGSTIGVISRNYEAISSEIKNAVGRFVASAREVLRTINTGLFLFCTARLQSEVADVFNTEAVSSKVSREEEMQLLTTQQQAYRIRALQALTGISEQTKRFRQDCLDMKRLASSLEVTRVMSKMEASRLDISKTGVDALVNDLELYQLAVSEGLSDIEQATSVIEATTQVIFREAQIQKSA